uniref:Uncharacterized protein n=1 Tax=Acrobeloides nanus TaxID=290746 RepID=A0A914D8X4_9BILA
MNFNSVAFLLLTSFIALILLTSTADARPRHRKHKRVLDEYEYRDHEDYNDSGVFVDSVPIKTTAEPHHAKLHSKTNRFPKLRKYFSSTDYFV